MKPSISESLGIYGWSHLDPVLLASLALEAPLLLVGPHGTAKSLLIERVAGALQLTFRHYNASLLNYDDLVGIPIPENGNLRFISTPGAIWEAEFVFFDEISRCRPDLQNKLFPIIHERKVAGVSLVNLQHRWAAMNPPSSDEENRALSVYLGAEALDPALIDRFLFILPVPDWEDLDNDMRRRIISDCKPAFSSDEFHKIITDCRQRVSQLQSRIRSRVGEYIIVLLDILNKSEIPLSTRRARMLTDGIIAVHAAHQCLDGNKTDLESSAELTTRLAIPQTASEYPPSIANLIAAHKQAWEVSDLNKDKSMRRIFREVDSYKRILIADQQNVSDLVLSKIITQALSQERCEARLIGVSVILFLKYQMDRDFPPATWELLASKARRVIEPRLISTRIPPGNDLNEWQKINAWAATLPKNACAQLERNFIFAGFPELWRQTPWQQALQQFRSDLDLFGLEVG